MKTILETRLNRRGRILATTALVLVLPPLVLAAFQATDLDVGMVGNNASTKSATIGANNSANNNSATIGTYNYATYQSAATGNANMASYWSTASGSYNTAHDHSFAAGYNNQVYNLSAAVGWQNDVNTAGLQYPRHGMAVGYMNFVYGNGAFAAGELNSLEANNAAAIGLGLANTSENATVVGSYNVDREDLRFAVGTGTGPTANERANAFEVYANGDIVMKPQGDISMGTFDDIP